MGLACTTNGVVGIIFEICRAPVVKAESEEWTRLVIEGTRVLLVRQISAVLDTYLPM